MSKRDALTNIGILPPIRPHEIPVPMRRGLETIAERAAAHAAVDGRGKDIIFRVYLAGLYHGAEIAREVTP